MKRLQQMAASLLKNEQGGEVLEYALIAGLIVVGCITAIAVVGGRIKFGWQYISSKL